MLVTMNAPELSARDFEAVRKILYEKAGINLVQGKEGLVKSRLVKRIRALGMASYEDYIKLIQGEAGKEELGRMIDVLTTNKTSFFRERSHFDFLDQHLLPSHSRGRELRIWSAGCSSGEEPYSIAMHLLERKERFAIGSLRILATDLSTIVLERARRGIYREEQMAGVSSEQRRRWFTVEKAEGETLYKGKPELRAPISYAWLNLMQDWPMKGPFDVIFCRNVMIYFDKPTQARLVERFRQLIALGGYLFVGHSESLTSIKHNYTYVQPAVYRRDE